MNVSKTSQIFQFPSTSLTSANNKNWNQLEVNSRVHDVSVNGYVEQFELHRGELKTVTFTADKAGTIDFISSIHQPTMHGQIMVMPRG